MKRVLASCFGLGRLPIAPGTWGSLPPTVIFVLMAGLGLSGLTISIVMAVLVLVGSIVCVISAPASIAATGKIDPSEVVADEFAGQAVTFLFLLTGPVSGGQIYATAIIGFLMFRFFDIFKPWPIRRLEKLPAGWGILADDLLAGVYAGVMLFLCRKIGLIEYIGGFFTCSGGTS